MLLFLIINYKLNTSFLCEVYFNFEIVYNYLGGSMDVNKLSLEEKIAQKLMFGVNSSNIDIIVSLIRDYQIGGVILYKNNYTSYDDMLKVIKKIKKANKNNKLPLFISVDQEGGRVNRMPSEFKVIKNNYDLSKKDINLIYENGLITGKMLSSLGINMNFAPVLDIYNGESKLLYNRCFYGEIADIIKASKEYIKGLKKNGVISVVKHFPGHGSTCVDSHILPPYVSDYNEILNKHIKPFEGVIRDNIDGLMVGHLIIKNMTKGLPASMSYGFVYEYLRKRYSYNGLVITDEVNMLSRSLIYNINLVKNSMLSSDIVLVKLKGRYNKFIEKYVKFIKKNPKYIDILDDSVKRIIEVKKKYKLTDDYDNLGCNVEEINKEITRINEV